MRPRKQKIRESFEELDELRRFYKGTVEEVKLTFLRLLKEDSGRPLADATRRLGITERRGRYWWETYCSNGLRGLLERRVWGREKLEKNVPKIEVRKNGEIRVARETTVPEQPASSIDYPAFINAVAGIAEITNPQEWGSALRDLIIEHFPEVNYAVISIRPTVNMTGDESPNKKRMVVRRSQNDTGEAAERFESTEDGKPNFKIVIESGQKRGFDFSRYHFPPAGFDFFLKRGKREKRAAAGQTSLGICLGSLLLFRHKHLSPFTPETLDMVERLRPYFTYVFTDFILRVRGVVPSMESYNATIVRISSEAKLSEREQDVLSLLFLGYSEKRIADALNISPKTVESHVYSMYRKTGVNKVTELFAQYQTPVGIARKKD